jgi:hypothetical protein
MKLELKHVAPYLPYGLKYKSEHIEGSRIYTMLGLNEKYNRLDSDCDYGWIYIKGIKPILRPLSDLTKEIEHNEERFVPFERIGWGNGTHVIPLILEGRIDVKEYYLLLEWHFDVSNLIGKKLAFDINTLKPTT